MVGYYATTILVNFMGIMVTMEFSIYFFNSHNTHAVFD